MATVPTGEMERELRQLYNRWLKTLPLDGSDVSDYIEKFKKQSEKVIQRFGGKAARLGAAQGFPAPKELPLSPHIGAVYDEMKQAAISASIALGLNARDVASGLMQTGIEASYHKLERLARTETVNAYWQNQWESTQNLDLVMLWSAESSARTCPWCLAKDGLIVDDPTIRDHPNGRCTLAPTFPGSVGLRKKSKNPRFLRNAWDGKVPEELGWCLGDLNSAISYLETQQAVTAMVSQGWTSAQAAKMVLSAPEVGTISLDRAGYSQILRSLESYAQQVWEGLRIQELPRILYQADPPPLATGLTMWKATPAKRGYAMEIPRGLYSYAVNKKRDAYLILGSPRFIEPVRSMPLPGSLLKQGTLDGPTKLIYPTPTRRRF